MYKFWTIILVPFPFTDLSSSKLRPALIVSNNTKSNDIIVSFISSKIDNNKSSIKILKEAKIFKESWLKVSSLVRLDKMATLSKDIALWELWRLPMKLLKEHKNIFYNIFWFNF